MTTESSVSEKFATYKRLIQAVGNGEIRCLLASGGPGVGKTFEAMATLAEFGSRITVTRNAGRTTPLALYRDLFNGRTTRNVAIFDDCDDAFKNKDCLNILKAATDTRNPRIIAWASSSRLVPCQRFDFAGRIIIITNRRIAEDPLLAPLIDRAHCFELVLSEDERLCRILSLLRSIAKSDAVYFEVSDWITRNSQTLQSLNRLTIRSAVKACELSHISTDWQSFAEQTLLA